MHKLTCLVTGKTILINEDYFQKKLKEKGTAEEVYTSYICREAKNLIKRGYSIADARTYLKVDNKNVEGISNERINEVLQKDSIEIINNVLKSCDEVTRLVNNIKDEEEQVILS